MDGWQIALLLKPFLLLILFGLICLPARFAVIKWMPECRLKRILLFTVSKHPGG
jgi:hypothetical protein